MPTLPMKLQELGRIRIGDRQPLANKQGSRPRTLPTFRLTSANKPRLEYTAKLYGGTVTPWHDGTEQRGWQLYTEATTLLVLVPPFNAFSQWNEIWSGGACQRRCDGTAILHSSRSGERGQPCLCAVLAPEQRLALASEGQACQTVTRLNLLLPDIPGIGVWRLDTRSYYAGMELQGHTALLERASAESIFITCTLAIDQRQVKRRNATGMLITQKFPVITLQPTTTMRQLVTRDILPADRLGAHESASSSAHTHGARAAAELFDMDLPSAHHQSSAATPSRSEATPDDMTPFLHQER